MRKSPVSVVMIYREVEVGVRERVKPVPEEPEDIRCIEGRLAKETGVEVTREEMYWRGRV